MMRRVPVSSMAESRMLRWELPSTLPMVRARAPPDPVPTAAVAALARLCAFSDLFLAAPHTHPRRNGKREGLVERCYKLDLHTESEHRPMKYPMKQPRL